MAECPSILLNLPLFSMASFIVGSMLWIIVIKKFQPHFFRNRCQESNTTALFFAADSGIAKSLRSPISNTGDAAFKGSEIGKAKMKNGSRLRCGACKRKGNYGVLTARNPMAREKPPDEPKLRADARQLSESPPSSPPRNKRYEPVAGPVGLVTLPDE
jgi:hypothetical protein